MILRESDLEFGAEPVRHPGRHEVVEGVLVRDGVRLAAVVKKMPAGPLPGAGRTRADLSLGVAREMLARGIPTPEPLGVVHKGGESWYVARRLDGAAQVREWFLQRDDPGRGAPRIRIPFEQLLAGVGRLARKMHDAGIFFRDFSDGNILVTREGAGFSIWLVDLTRAKLGGGPVPLWNRLRDLSRLGLNRPDDRKLLLLSYFEPQFPPAGVEKALSLFRFRLVTWDALKDRARPWRRRGES